ncbi:MAG: class I SAM-dependent methyltransferase [Desulfurobacteriaceae bacterium]
MKAKEIFNSRFAIYYEKVINRFSSPIQIDRWRKELVKGALDFCPSASVILDFCSGAGNVGKFFLKEKPESILINCDISKPLLGLAKENFKKERNVYYVCSDNRFFPVKECSVDVIFSSFCVRNSPEPLLTIKEAKRVLKNKGVWAILDFFKIEKGNFCTVTNNVIFKSFMKLNKLFLPSNSEAINYLFESIEKFYTVNRFKEILSSYGFKIVRFRNFMGGIASVLIAIKEEV